MSFSRLSMAGFLLLAMILCFSSLTQAVPDPCAQYSSCKTCVSHYLCGWCSMPVVYPDNKTGTQCAGFNPNGTDPFACNGIYSTDECVAGYTCNMENFTCDLAQPGQGTSQKQCEENCTNTGQVFLCNKTSKTCHQVPPNTPNNGSMESCMTACEHPSPHPNSHSPHSSSPAQTYTCNFTTGTCDTAKPGHGSSMEVCEKQCQKEGTSYYCNHILNQCMKLPDGTKGETKQQCEEQCNPKPKPGPPPNFLGGMWRGIEIQNHYSIGEWDMKFTQTTATLVDLLNAVTIKGVPYHVTHGDVIDLWIKITAGPGAGQTIKAISESANRGPETTFLTAAFGKPGDAAPSSLPGAMTDGSSKVFFLSQCAGTPECHFRMPAGNPKKNQKTVSTFDALSSSSFSFEDRVNEQDHCSPYAQNCSFCLSHQYCGWCSTDVIYKGGVKGTQCAGFATSPNQTNAFVCEGRYSTLNCSYGYECDEAKHQCVQNPTPGNGMPKELCEELCKNTPSPSPLPPQYVCNVTTRQCHKCNKTHCPGSMPKQTCEASCVKPKPGPTSLVTGIWRGIAIQNNYPLGEYDWVFNSSGVKVYKNGKFDWSGTIESFGGDVMIFAITKASADHSEDVGKRFGAIYTVADQGGMYEAMTLAVEPDGHVPQQYATPMRTKGEYEMVLAKCGAKPCQFTAP